MIYLLFATPIIGTIAIVVGVFLSKRFMPLRYEEASEEQETDLERQNIAREIVADAEAMVFLDDEEYQDIPVRYTQVAEGGHLAAFEAASRRIEERLARYKQKIGEEHLSLKMGKLVQTVLKEQGIVLPSGPVVTVNVRGRGGRAKSVRVEIPSLEDKEHAR